MNWLEKICDDYNVSIYEIAKKTGVSQSYLYKIVKQNIPISDIKVGQYVAILEFIQKNDERFTTFIPHVDGFYFSTEIKRFDDILLEKGIPELDELVNCHPSVFSAFMIMKNLSSHFHFYKNENYELYWCRKKSYFDALYKIDNN